MVIPAFTFSNHFFLALGIGDAWGTKKINKIIIIRIVDSSQLTAVSLDSGRG